MKETALSSYASLYHNWPLQRYLDARHNKFQSTQCRGPIVSSNPLANAQRARNAAWGEWRKEFYHEEIKKISAPVLLIAGEHEHLIGFDADSMGEDVKRLQKATCDS
jgi:pimeloyl-ACP methyl ester carboxylesterase